MNIIKEVQRELLWHCRKAQPITAEFTMAQVGSETNFYLEEGSCLCFTNQEIGALMLNALGLNSLNYENVAVLFDLDVFAGVILDGDSENGIAIEWFTIEVDEDGNGTKYLRCIYGRSRNVEEV